VARGGLTLASLMQQAANLRDSLEAVTDADRAVLTRKPAYDTVDELVVTWTRRLDRASEAADTFSGAIRDLLTGLPSPDNGELPLADELSHLESETRQILVALQDQASKARQSLKDGRGEGSRYATLSATWAMERARFEAEYERVKVASTTHESKLAELADVERRERETREAVAVQREELKRLGDPAAEHTRLRQEWLNQMRVRSERLDAQCVELTTLSEGLLRAAMRRARGLADVSQRFRGAISGSGLRAAKLDSFFESLGQESDSTMTWELALAELERVLGSDPDARLTSEQTPVLARLGLAPADVKRIVSRLSPEGWLELALTPLVDSPNFEYRRKPGEYIQFAVASAGQQATALLRVLLNQGGPPLLIDQLEEDLVTASCSAMSWVSGGRSRHRPSLVR
jgi:hypothetical protein